MDFPPRLLTPIIVQGIVTGIEYALYLGGARGISLEVLESDLDHHTFRLTWARRGA